MLCSHPVTHSWVWLSDRSCHYEAAVTGISYSGLFLCAADTRLLPGEAVFSCAIRIPPVFRATSGSSTDATNKLGSPHCDANLPVHPVQSKYTKGLDTPGSLQRHPMNFFKTLRCNAKLYASWRNFRTLLTLSRSTKNWNISIGEKKGHQVCVATRPVCQVPSSYNAQRVKASGFWDACRPGTLLWHLSILANSD